MSDFEGAIVLQDQVRSINEPFDLNGAVLKNAGYPQDPNDLVTKSYVDAVAVGLDFKNPVRVATVGDLNTVFPVNIQPNNYQIEFSNNSITITVDEMVGTDDNGEPMPSGLAVVIDGVVLNINDRILVKNQTDLKRNGIYYYKEKDTQLHSLLPMQAIWRHTIVFERTADAIPPALSQGAFVIVLEGNQNANSGYVLTTSDPINLGVSDIVFVKFPTAGNIINAGAGLTLDNSTLSVNVDNDTITIQSNALKVNKVYANQVEINSGDGNIVIVNNSNKLTTAKIIYEYRTINSNISNYQFITQHSIKTQLPPLVFRNGVLLAPNKYTVNSDKIIFNTALKNNDVVSVIYYTEMPIQQQGQA